MADPETFLVIDDNADSRFLLVKTLLRKFPGAEIHETHSAEQAVDYAGRRPLSAIVSHRTTEMTGLAVLRRLRETCPATPVVMVSSIDRRHAAIAAGAAAFLLYDEWLRIGSVVAEVLTRARSVALDTTDLDNSAEPADAG